MFESERESTGDAGLDDALAQAEWAVRALVDVDLDSLVRLDGPSAGLHAAARRVERLKSQLVAFESGYVAAIETAAEPARFACSSTAVFLREQLRLSIGEARRRVRVAHAIGPRTSMTGEALAPALPQLAAAVAGGAVSGEQAGVIQATMDALPDPVRDEHGTMLERELVDAAAVADPARLAAFGRQVLDHSDPDGVLRDHAYAQAHRHLTMTEHRGRSGGRIHGELSEELLEKLRVVLEPLAKPMPAVEGDEVSTRDQRSPGQRAHDALLTVIDHTLDCTGLPASGGTPTTLVFHTTPGAAADPHGVSISEHGRPWPVAEALAVADEAVVYSLTRKAKGVPLSLGRIARLASPGQTAALAARDGGCSFPGCTRPPSFCQRHHIVPWHQGGRTDLDNLTLLCAYHHREFERRGWSVEMIDGRPAWRPPGWIDPQRRPIYNYAHPPLPEAG